MRLWRSILVVAIFSGFLLGCDQVSGLSEGKAPTVADLEVTPDSVNAADLPPDLVNDSTAQVPLRVSVRASDPDGEVERVSFTFEPVTNPQGAAFGQLEATGEGRYAREFAISVPAMRDEVYALRVFAVDSDSLASNEAIGRVRFVPASE